MVRATETQPLAPGVVYAPESGYIMLHVPPVVLPETVLLHGVAFGRKRELACSLLNARRLAGDAGEMAERQIVRRVRTQLEATPVELDAFTGDLYHCTHSSGLARQTIIGMVGLHGAGALYDNLREAYNPELPDPAPHVTLYTNRGEWGIAIPDAAALAEYCTPLPDPLAAQLRPALTAA